MTARITGYGVGSAKVDLAPLPTVNNGVPTSNTLFDFGQLIYNKENSTWYIYTGAGLFIPISGGGIGGFTWTPVTNPTQSAAINNGYIANYSGTLVLTLPAVSQVGAMIAITGINNATGWKVAQNAGNQIFYGIRSTTSGTGGYVESTNTYDTAYFLCTAANTNWTLVNSIGNLTIV